MKRSTTSKTKPKLLDHTFSFDAIGTRWQIELTLTDETAMTAIETVIRQRIDQFDALYSRFRSDSLISTMAKRAGTYRLPADAQPLFDLYESLYQRTDGAFTPLIGQVLVDAGYDAAYSLQPKALRRPPDWRQVLVYDYPMLTLKKPVLLDVGAAGKGYLVDIISEMLANKGIESYVINAGGDILQRSSAGKTLQVALEHPRDTTQAIGVAAITNQSICGSSGNRRAWRGMHHIINPHSLQPVADIIAVWVVADTTMLADALSTCLFFVSPNQLKTTYTFEYALVRSDDSLEYSSGFPATFF